MILVYDICVFLEEMTSCENDVRLRQTIPFLKGIFLASKSVKKDFSDIHKKIISQKND